MKPFGKATALAKNAGLKPRPAILLTSDVRNPSGLLKERFFDHGLVIRTDDIPTAQNP
jgi:hypothetical protein